MAFGENVQVEEDLFCGILGGLAAIDGVLLALDGARVIFKAAEGIGDAEVGLLNAAEHLLVELFLKGVGGLEISVGIGVFGFEVREDAGVLFVAEPGVMVHAAVIVDDVLNGFADGKGRPQTGGAGFSGRGSGRVRSPVGEKMGSRG
jgi:hypothetical protein